MKAKFRTAAKYSAFAIIFTLVAGCENPHIVQLKDEFGWTESRMLRDGWLKARVVAQKPVYCYHTLAEADCFSQAKPSHRDRLVGSSGEGIF